MLISVQRKLHINIKKQILSEKGKEVRRVFLVWQEWLFYSETFRKIREI